MDNLVLDACLFLLLACFTAYITAALVAEQLSSGGWGGWGGWGGLEQALGTAAPHCLCALCLYLLALSFTALFELILRVGG